MYIALHVQYPLFCQILIELKIFRHILEKRSNSKFYENASSGGRVVPCGLTNRQGDKRTDIVKLIVALHNFEHARKSNDV
jgi:hypothetical protein